MRECDENKSYKINVVVTHGKKRVAGWMGGIARLVHRLQYFYVLKRTFERSVFQNGYSFQKSL